MGIKWPHGCFQSKAPFEFHTVFLCFSPHVALDPTNTPHVIRSWISRPTCTKCACVSMGVSFHSYACVWRWFRNCLPANKDLYVMLSQNTGLPSKPSCSQTILRLGRFTLTWPHCNLTCQMCLCFVIVLYVCACINMYIYLCLSQCHNPKVICKIPPHLHYRPNKHSLSL